MHLPEQIIALMRAYADGLNVPITTASKRSAGTASTINRLLNGGGISERRFLSIRSWFHEHWPDGVVWPEGVARPEVTP